MTVADIPLVHRIDAGHSSFSWSLGLFKESLINDHCFILLDNDQLVGFFILSQVLDEFCLLNIAIDLSCCRKGYGGYLFSKGMDFCRQNHGQQCYLEVRESNTAAIGLYEKHEFRQVGLRKNYYPALHGRENALIMSLNFSE